MQKLNLQQIRTLIIVLLIALSSMLGTDIHLASLPHIAVALNTNQQRMEQSISIFLLGLGLSLFIYGPLSDKYGRKPIVIIGLLIAVVSCFSIVFSAKINMFLFWRFWQGIGLGVGSGIGRTIFADILTGEALAIIGSYFSTCMSISPLFAPMLGGYLQHFFGWQSNFIVLGIFCLIIAILFAYYCPETNLHKNKKLSLQNMTKNYLFVIKNPIFVNSTFLTGISMSVIMVYATTSSFIFQKEFNLNSITYGYITAISGCGAFVGKIIGPSIIKKFTILKAIQIGLLIVLISGLISSIFVFINIHSITLILLCVFVAYIGTGLIMPSVSAKALGGFHDKRGAAAALYGTFQMIIAALGTSIVAALPFKGTHLLSFSYLVLGALGLFVYGKLKKYSHK